MYQFKFLPVVFLFITYATHIQGAASSSPAYLQESDVILFFEAARNNNVTWFAERCSSWATSGEDLLRLTEPERGDFLLHAAVRSGSLDVVKLLLAHDEYGCCRGSQNKERDTPLHIAIDKPRYTLGRYFSMIDALLDAKGANRVVQVKWKQADSPLHRMKARLEKLEKSHCGFESQFMRGLRQRISRMLDMALCCDYSAPSGHIYPPPAQRIFTLLALGANPRARTADGSTPLHIACRWPGSYIGGISHTEHIEVLLSHDPLLLSEKDNEGKEPLAIMAGKSPSQYCPGDIEFLHINYKPNIHAQDNNGRTALHEACLWNNWRGINELVEAGAFLDARDNEGNTPLHTRALLDARDNVGNTPLHTVISVIRKAPTCDAFKALLRHGANPLLKNNARQTVYDLLVAIEAGFLEEIKMDPMKNGTYDKFLISLRKEDLKKAEEKFVLPQTHIVPAEPAIPIHRRFDGREFTWTLGY